MEVHLIIQQSEILDHPLKWFDMNNKEEESLRTIEDKLKSIINYRWGNSHMRWSNIFGDCFSILLSHGPKLWQLTVWDYKGNTSICTISQEVINEETDILSKENHKLLMEKTENYSRGIVPCSGCGKEIKITEIAGRYFAGVYCQHCWDTKYKAIEAKENYE